MSEPCHITGWPVPEDAGAQLLRQVRAVLACCAGTSPSAERRRRETLARLDEALTPQPTRRALPPLPNLPPLG